MCVYHVSWQIPSLFSLSLYYICFSGPYNPTMLCPWEATPFLSLRENNFDIFLLGLIPNRKNVTFSPIWFLLLSMPMYDAL